MLTRAQIQDAIRAYVKCALWSSDVSEDDDTSLLQAGYTIDDIIDWRSVGEMARDVRAFIVGCDQFRPGIFGGIDPEQIGHDFWLTRNGHGAGFWDRGLGERGDYLTSMAKPHGEAYLIIGDDGGLYYHG